MHSSKVDRSNSESARHNNHFTAQQRVLNARANQGKQPYRNRKKKLR